jgi:hypothetical protein
LENSRTMSLNKPWVEWDRITLPNYGEFRWSVKQNSWIWKGGKTPSEMWINVWQDAVVKQSVKESVKQITNQTSEVINGWIWLNTRLKTLITNLKWWEKIVALKDAIRKTIKDLIKQLDEAKVELKNIKKTWSKEEIKVSKNKINEIKLSIVEANNALKAPENFIDRPIKYWLITAALVSWYLERNIRVDWSYDSLIYGENLEWQTDEWIEIGTESEELAESEEWVVTESGEWTVTESGEWTESGELTEIDNDNTWKNTEKNESETKKFNDAKSFYRRIWASSKKLDSLQNALLTNWEELPKYKDDWKFWKETFEAIKSFQTKNNLNDDWIAWTQTLKALGLIKEWQTSKDFYKKGAENHKLNKKTNEKHKRVKEIVKKSNENIHKNKIEHKQTELPIRKNTYDNTQIIEAVVPKISQIPQKNPVVFNEDNGQINLITEKELDINWEKVTIVDEGNEKRRLIIDDVQSPTVITWVPVWQEKTVVKKYTGSSTDFIDTSDSHTYEEFMWND